MDTPVVLIVFNRPDLTERVLQAIAQAKPRQLLVIADGPRFDHPGETEKCRQTRALLQTIDWPCDVHTNFSVGNLGCRRRVVTGLDWVFSQVQEAIILEDDCIPHPSFFGYCAELLERYRNEPRIMQISGNNLQPADWTCDHSYYFSRYIHMWGWATWRRAWNMYDVRMERWPSLRKKHWLTTRMSNAFEAAMWQRAFDETHADLVDTWDTQWLFTCWSQGGLSVVPSVNLVSNIGFRADATHTIRTSCLANCPTAEIGPLRHPDKITASPIEDTREFLEVYNGRSFIRRNRWYRRAARAPMRFLGHLFSNIDLWR